MPKMMKNVQQISTILPIGRSDDNRVWTTSFKPGARFITLSGLNDLSNLKTCCMKELKVINIYFDRYIGIRNLKINVSTYS